MKKRFLSLVTVLAMTAAFIVLPTAANAATSGTCGNNLTWVLDGGALTISGSGAMDDYTISSSVPWGTSITSVKLGNGITSIGENAFYNCSDLTSIEIPNGLTSIGAYAFCFDLGLTSINIPKSVTTINKGAFQYCSYLADVYYEGSEADWAKINIDSVNNGLSFATIHYNASSEITVILNNTKLSFDQPPVMINDRTMVPIRAIFEAIGYTVNWNDATQTATAVKGSDSITVQINNSVISYVTNGQAGTYTCDVAPQIVSDRTLVPTRAIAESAGCTVTWDESTQTVYITK